MKTCVILVAVVCVLSGCHLIQPDGEKHWPARPRWWDRNVYENLEPTPGSTNARQTNTAIYSP